MLLRRLTDRMESIWMGLTSSTPRSLRRLADRNGSVRFGTFPDIKENFHDIAPTS